MTAPVVDVIIAARDEAGRVGECVDVLRRQDCAGPLRICVVDNASTDATASVAAAHGAEVLREARRGRGAARNAGLKMTHGALVAFLDAHVVVGPDWVRRMAERFDDPRVGACQGRLDHRASDARVQRYLEASAALSAERSAASSVRAERDLYPWLPTGNCMYRRAALESVGGFDERLVACEDVELSWRIITRGYRLVCLQDTTATHYEGRSWLRFVTKGFWYGRGAAQVEALYLLHGARTAFRDLRLRRRHPEEVLESLSYRFGFRLQRLWQRFGLAPPLEPIPPCAVDAMFRPWFMWTQGMRLRISPHAVYWLYDDRPGSVVVQPGARQRVALDGTADYVWRLLACERARDEVLGRIATEYGIPAATASADLDELIDELIAGELLQRDSGPAMYSLGAR